LIFSVSGLAATFNPRFLPAPRAVKTGDGTGAGREEPPLPGLSPREDGLRRLLFRYRYKANVWVLPRIPVGMLSAARKSCRVPAADRVLGLLDFTGSGKATDAMLFGCQGLYYHNPDASVQPGPGAIPYQEFAGRSFVNHGEEVYLDNDQFLCPNARHSGVDCEQLTALLHEVRQLLAGPPS